MNCSLYRSCILKDIQMIKLAQVIPFNIKHNLKMDFLCWKNLFYVFKLLLSAWSSGRGYKSKVISQFVINETQNQLGSYSYHD